MDQGGSRAARVKHGMIAKGPISAAPPAMGIVRRRVIQGLTLARDGRVAGRPGTSDRDTGAPVIRAPATRKKPAVEVFGRENPLGRRDEAPPVSFGHC